MLLDRRIPKDAAQLKLQHSRFVNRTPHFHFLPHQPSSLIPNSPFIMASNAETSGDAFTFIDRTVEEVDGGNRPPQLFPKYGDLTSAKLANPVLQLFEELRGKYPEYVVTFADPYSLNLLAFAFAGKATATLDIETDSVFRERVWTQPFGRDTSGTLAEARFFAKYQYRWGNEDFILYSFVIGLSNAQFILKERGPGEGQLSHSVITDTLLAQVGLWSH